MTGPAHHQPGWEGHLPSSRGIFLPADPGPSGLLGGDGRIQNCRVRRQTRRHLSQTQVSTCKSSNWKLCVFWIRSVPIRFDLIFCVFMFLIPIYFSASLRWSILSNCTCTYEPSNWPRFSARVLVFSAVDVKKACHTCPLAWHLLLEYSVYI